MSSVSARTGCKTLHELSYALPGFCPLPVKVGDSIEKLPGGYGGTIITNP